MRPVVPTPTPAPAESVDRNLRHVDSLLSHVEDAAAARADQAFENQLVQVRMGLASSLFTALRVKHAPTASHSLRMAIGCSAWAQTLGMPAEMRDEVEVGALLHDVGKLGVPDHILSKPGKLTLEEQLDVDSHRRMGMEILQSCCASQTILDIVRYSGTWYNGKRGDAGRKGDELPLGARMVAILDAFDAMTTDRVYRPAMSRERALAELFQFAGSQFDPNLVKLFHAFVESNQQALVAGSARRWLADLRPESSHRFFSLQAASPVAFSQADDASSLFHRSLLEQMQSGVVFLDMHGRVTMWNRASERMTGVAAEGLLHRDWSPTLVAMRNASGSFATDEDCPVLAALRTGRHVQAERMKIRSRGDRTMTIDVSAAPVVGPSQTIVGAMAIFRDASRQTALEQHLVSLHDKATRDPLTKVHNRAEFDRVHTEFVKKHLTAGTPCSLVISDIDFFKRINDDHGHQAGDEALVLFAAIMQRHARSEDLVARYGGEEFVLLCADCDGATAARRADELRKQLSETPMSCLGGACVTASFGVTEIQNGDTPETMLRRADRGLLQAKDNGRNRVVQLGAGIRGKDGGGAIGGLSRWLGWLTGAGADEPLVDQLLITSVPLKLSVQKLRGFVADNEAKIVQIKASQVKLEIDGQSLANQRRADDRATTYVVDVDFEEMETTEGRKGAKVTKTLVRVVIRPKRGRDRRRHDALERAGQLLSSFKSYLVADEYDPDAKPTA